MSATPSPAAQKVPCLKCGNNPTSHVMARIDTFLFFVMNPFMQWFLRTWAGRALLFVINYCWRGVLALGTRFHFMYFVPVADSGGMDRGEVIAREAKARGYQIESLRVFGRANETYRITFSPHYSLTYTGVPRLDPVTAVTSGWLDDKWLLKRCLLKAGVPVSNGRSVLSWRGAKKVFAAVEKPVIVKPRFGSRGRHTTTHIHTEEQLATAYRSARELGWPVIVEEHLVGSVYRATCIGGELAGVLAGDPPRITGDGVHTITELIEKKNDSRPKRVAAVTVTPKHVAFLKQLGYSLDSILPSGQEIDLSEKIGLSYGGSSREVTLETHPKLKAILAKAAVATGDPIVGFDFITSDVSVDPDTVKWGIIECNSVPFINLHHDPLIGKPINVAAVLLDYLEAHIPITQR